MYIITIKAEDRPALLHLVTGVLNKKLITIISLNAAQTDIHDIVLITMQVEVPENALGPLLAKLQNIIEVYTVEAVPLSRAFCLRAAYFKLDKAILDSPLRSAFQKFGAQIANIHPGTILVSIYGSEVAIRLLYNELEGPYLLGLSQTGVIADSKLIGHDKEDQSSVISLAA
jgi:acetolactate synthase small subunit